MSWYATSLLLFGCLAVAFATGMTAAFAFFAINVVGAYQYLGGNAGLSQLVRNGVASITNFSLTPIPFFILMGEVLFHTGVAMKAIDAIERFTVWFDPAEPV
jgi:TRAP-type mannitol/chloroaromatic compound transport system permease large subunit